MNLLVTGWRSLFLFDNFVPLFHTALFVRGSSEACAFSQVGFKSRYWLRWFFFFNFRFPVEKGSIGRDIYLIIIFINFCLRFGIKTKCNVGSTFNSTFLQEKNQHLNLHWNSKIKSSPIGLFRFWLCSWGNQQLKNKHWQCSQFLDLNPTYAFILTSASPEATRSNSFVQLELHVTPLTDLIAYNL